jgi:hypothetical protein
MVWAGSSAGTFAFAAQQISSLNRGAQRCQVGQLTLLADMLPHAHLLANPAAVRMGVAQPTAHFWVSMHRCEPMPACDDLSATPWSWRLHPYTCVWQPAQQEGWGVYSLLPPGLGSMPTSGCASGACLQLRPGLSLLTHQTACCSKHYVSKARMRNRWTACGVQVVLVMLLDRRGTQAQRVPGDSGVRLLLVPGLVAPRLEGS